MLDFHSHILPGICNDTTQKVDAAIRGAIDGVEAFR
jgi:hypothetical protein